MAALPPPRLYDMLCRGVVQVSKKVQVWGRLGGGSGEGSEWKRGGGEVCNIRPLYLGCVVCVARRGGRLDTRLIAIVLVEWGTFLKMAEAANWYYHHKPQTPNPKPL